MLAVHFGIAESNVGNSIFQASITSKHKRYRLKYQCKHEF